MNGAALIGWAGVAVGVGGLLAYFAIVLRQPKTVRMLNGSGLLLTSLALFQARMLTALAAGPFAFGTEACVVLLVLSVIVQAAAGWRNRGAWNGLERRQDRAWDGADRRASPSWDGLDRRTEPPPPPWDGIDRRANDASGETKA